MTIPKGYELHQLETPTDLAPILDAWRLATPIHQRKLLGQLNVKPSLIYKFRAFSGEFSETNLQDVILHSVLRLAAPSEFDDPYELHVRIEVGGSPAEREQRFRIMADQRGSKLSASERETMIVRLLATPDEQHIENVQRSLAGIRQRSGVISFAEHPYSILMWSHYADHHKGICLQFHRTKNFPTFGHAVHVDYKEELPRPSK